MKKEKNSLILIAVILVSFMAAITIGLYFIDQSNLSFSQLLIKEQKESIDRTEEAKIFSDRSKVNRIGSNCESSSCPEIMGTLEFGDLVNFTIGKQIKFRDGLTVKLIKIYDSRCEPDVVCIWAGEILFIFNITGGDLGNLSQEIRLGTETAKYINKGGYMFELKEATENTATVIITKN